MPASNKLHALTVGLAAAMALPFIAPARAADEAHTLKVRLEWISSGYQAPFYLAEQKGWFKKAGLDVAIEPGNGSNTTIQLVASGQYDAGEAALSNMAFARAKGVPTTSIAGYFRKGDLALLIPIASPIKTPADIKGKKIIFTAGSSEGPFLDMFFASGGITRDQVQLLNIDNNTRISTYTNGDADGLFGSPVGTMVLLQEKRPSRPIYFADYGLNLPGYGIVTTPAALKAKGEALRSFASIVSGAWTYILAGHEEEGVSAIVAERAQDRPDPAIMRTQLHASIPFLHTKATADLPIGVQSEADWKESLTVMEQAKTIEPGSKPADYFTNDYLDPKTIKLLAGS